MKKPKRHGESAVDDIVRGRQSVIRIHDLIWLKIDNNGFATLKRKSEGARSKDCEITIPKPVRTQGELNALLATLMP